jgi:hypothetical protein
VFLWSPGRMGEYADDYSNTMEAWRDTFNTVLADNGGWTCASMIEQPRFCSIHSIHDELPWQHASAQNDNHQ